MLEIVGPHRLLPGGTEGEAMARDGATRASVPTPALILDLDAHCGGGTDELVGHHPAVRIADIAVDAFDQYQPAPGNSLELVRDPTAYLPTLRRRLDALAGESFGLVLYNAGMDPHQHCPVGGLQGIDELVLAQRERIVFEWCRRRGLPVAFVLAGGYIGPRLAQDKLVALHRLTLSAALHT